MRWSKSVNSVSRWQMSGRNNAWRTRSDTFTGPGFKRIIGCTGERLEASANGKTPTPLPRAAYLWPAFLLYRLHEPSRNIRRIEHDPARIFGQFVHLHQQHARAVLLEHVFELVDEIFPLTHPLHVDIPGGFGDLFERHNIRNRRLVAGSAVHLVIEDDMDEIFRLERADGRECAHPH